MLRKIALTILLAAAVAISVTAAAANDNPKFLTATGQEYMFPVQLGAAKCAGGAPTGAYPQCSVETNKTLVRGELDSGYLAGVTGSASAMFDGATTAYVVNCNLDRNLKGECWGTFEMTIPDQGKWEGTFNGTFDLANFIASYSAVGHGSGPKLNGLQMKYEAIWNALAYATFNVRVDSK